MIRNEASWPMIENGAAAHPRHSRPDFDGCHLCLTSSALTSPPRQTSQGILPAIPPSGGFALLLRRICNRRLPCYFLTFIGHDHVPLTAIDSQNDFHWLQPHVMQTHRAVPAVPNGTEMFHRGRTAAPSCKTSFAATSEICCRKNTIAAGLPEIV